MIEFAKNKNGVRIKKCCASCQFMAYGKGNEERICCMGEGSVPKNWCCEDWTISPVKNNIKMQHFGQLKRPHYIAWMADNAGQIADQDLDATTKRDLLNKLPRVYEEIYGSRYLPTQVF